MKGELTLHQVTEMYKMTSIDAKELALCERITAEQVARLHRRAQAKVAAKDWDRCEAGARAVLRNSHPHVACWCPP